MDAEMSKRVDVYKRQEATGREAQTLHRMLEVSGGPEDDRIRTQFCLLYTSRCV